MKALRPQGLLCWSPLAALAVAGVLLSSGCTSGAPDAEGPSVSDARGEAEEVAVEVLRGSTVIAALSISDIQALPRVAIEAGGKEQTGPTLRAVLAAAGVQAFNEVTVSGMRPGRLVSGELTLSNAEVTDQVVLDITRRGTLKLASPSIPSEQWIIDVTRLAVK